MEISNVAVRIMNSTDNTITITHSVPSDYRVGIPTRYTDAEFADLVRARGVEAGFLDFTDQPDDVVIAEAEANAELLRITFDAAHGIWESDGMVARW